MRKKDSGNTFSIGGATFLVRIQYRQNTSWQGTVQWLEEKKTCVFRSELELMMLINKAVEMSGLQGADNAFTSWGKQSLAADT